MNENINRRQFLKQLLKGEQMKFKNKKEEHDYHVNRINLHPQDHIILDRNGNHELSDIVMSGTVNFMDNKRLIAQPDGFLVSKWGDLYIFEYKLDGGQPSALRQVKNAKSFMQKYQTAFDYNSLNFLHVCGTNPAGTPYKTTRFNLR